MGLWGLRIACRRGRGGRPGGGGQLYFRRPRCLCWGSCSGGLGGQRRTLADGWPRSVGGSSDRGDGLMGFWGLRKPCRCGGSCNGAGGH